MQSPLQRTWSGQDALRSGAEGQEWMPGAAYQEGPTLESIPRKAEMQNERSSSDIGVVGRPWAAWNWVCFFTNVWREATKKF